MDTIQSNSSFSLINPSLQIAWDATSYNELLTCPRKYEYSIIRGFTLEGTNSHIIWGQIFHAASETYDRVKTITNDHEKSLIAAIRCAITETWDSKHNRPWTSDESTKTRDTLIRTIIMYLDTYKDDNLETFLIAGVKPAVELAFQFNLNDISADGSFRASTGEEYQLCGYLDKVVSWNQEIWIRDIKTTKYELDETYFKQYTPDAQVSIYSIAGYVVLHQNIDGIIIDGIQTQVHGSRFRRKQIPRSPDMLEEFLHDFWIRMKEAETYASINHWPMNTKSCGWGNMQCKFRMVCSSEPAAREDLLNNFYTKRIWNPLIPR